MELDKRTREQMLALCGEIHDDDGVDPRRFFTAGRNESRENHRAKRLCRQVAETLDQVLAGEIADDRLRGLRVVEVAPAPDATRLLVTLSTDHAAFDFDRVLVEKRLAASLGFLRSEIAAAITRRKTPLLRFNVRGPEKRGESVTEEDRR